MLLRPNTAEVRARLDYLEQQARKPHLFKVVTREAIANALGLFEVITMTRAACDYLDALATVDPVRLRWLADELDRTTLIQVSGHMAINDYREVANNLRKAADLIAELKE